MLQQQQQFSQLMQKWLARRNERPASAGSVVVPERVPNEPLNNSGASEGSTPSDSSPAQEKNAGGRPSGSMISWLSKLIPEFAGAKEDNVRKWVERVDRIAQVHGATDGMTLVAASNWLVKEARTWYDAESGAVLESWTGLREELIRYFDRRLPFYTTMSRIEARKWLPHKETFDQYAIDKLALIGRLDLSVGDRIDLLIRGVMQSSMRATVLSIRAKIVDEFLKRMRHITDGVAELEERKPSAANIMKSKEIYCRNCGKKGHINKDCKVEFSCFYCKQKGHRRIDCPVLKKKEAKQQPTWRAPAVESAASVSQEPTSDFVAAVVGPRKVLETEDTFINVDSLCENSVKLAALIDTGSPVSFVKLNVYDKYIVSSGIAIQRVENRYINLDKRPLDIKGSVNVKITLSLIPNFEFVVNLNVLREEIFEGDIILGRDFLRKQRFTLFCTLYDEGEQVAANLFSHLPLNVVDLGLPNDLEQTIEDSISNVDSKIRDRLKSLIMNIQNSGVSPVNERCRYDLRIRPCTLTHLDVLPTVKSLRFVGSSTTYWRAKLFRKASLRTAPG